MKVFVFRGIIRLLDVECERTGVREVDVNDHPTMMRWPVHGHAKGVWRDVA